MREEIQDKGIDAIFREEGNTCLYCEVNLELECLCLRPSALISQCAKNYPDLSSSLIRTSQEPKSDFNRANPKSVLELLNLGAMNGEMIKIQVSGIGERNNEYAKSLYRLLKD